MDGIEASGGVDGLATEETDPQPVYLVGELARLVLKPGDRLVVKLKKKKTQAEQQELYRVFQDWVGPKIPVIVIEPWITLGVIASEESDG